MSGGPEKAPIAAQRIAGLSPRDLELLVERLRKTRAERPSAGGAGVAGIERRPADNAEPPLSFAQERLWFLSQLDPVSPAYNVASAVELLGPLSVAALARSLALVVARHQVLRTAVASLAGRPVCRLQASATASLPVVDLDALPAGCRGAESQRLAGLLGRLPFDLGRPPLLRSCLLRRGAAEHLLVLVLHHIVADAWSAALLVRELGILYAGLLSGGVPRLPELPIQYGDFAAWQRQWLTAERLEGEIEHWRRTLDGLPLLELPTDSPRPAVRSGSGALIPVVTSGDLADGLGRAGRALGVTPFTLLLAAFAALLGRYSGQEDFAIGSPVAGRARPEVEPLIGCFVNTLALRADLAGDPPFRTLVDRLWQVRTAASAHQEVPFEKLVESLAPERSLAHAPLFQVMLAFEGQEIEPALPGLEAAVQRLDTGTAKFDFTLALGEGRRGLSGWIEYSRELFAAATVTRMAGHWVALLAAALEQPATPVSELPLLSAAERHQLLAEPAAPPSAPAAALHHLFEAQAAAGPERPALVWRGECLTYRELNRRANRLAQALLQRGVGPEVPVGILLERGPAAVVSILATLKAGGAYLPLDPRYPAERLALMLGQAGSPLVITRRELAAELPEAVRWKLLLLGDERDERSPEPEDDESPGMPVAAEGLAYLIYTSGSTGVPKGVALAHRGAVELMAWAREAFSPDERAEVLATTSFSFDLSVFELFVPLSWGGTVLLAEDALHLAAAGGSPRLLNTVPSVMAELVRTGAVPPSVRTVNLAGEPLPRPLVERIYAATGARRVLNLYGPTEDTTYSTWTEIAAGGAGPVPLGRPLPGARVHLLDRRLEPVPLGVPGELCLASTSLARGYLGRVDLTAERFLPDPWSAAPGQRMYRSGDLALRRPDGRLEYLGRIDQQVKIRGFRIELGEIEAVLCRQPGIAEAAVVAAREEGEGPRLVAFVVPAAPPALPASPALDAEEVRRLLRRTLPEFFVPSAIVSLEALPRTPTGKLDRRTLQQAGASARQPSTARTAPRTPVAQLLAGVWEELLERSGIGLEDGFFDLGGHSLLATRMVARVREALGVELSVHDVFTRPTLAGLAERVEAGIGTALREGPPLEVRREGGEAPLSFAQERLWFLDRLAPGSALYNMPAFFRVEGALDAAVLGRSLGEVVRRHEVLRAVFRESGGGPVQAFSAPAPVPLPVEDLSALAAAAQEAQVERRAAEEAARPFDLGRGPLLRAVLLRLGRHRSVLLLSLHHIAFDGGSSAVLLGELSALYRAFAQGLPSPLPELPLQYSDFAAWQRRRLSGRVLEELLAHWRERLSGAPELLALPTDRPRRPSALPSRGGRRPMELGERSAALLRERAQSEGVTPFMVLAAALAAVLSRHSGSHDLLLGYPIADRPRRELEGLIGLFVNTLVLRADLAGDPTVSELLRRVRSAALDGYAHRELPFEKLIADLHPRRATDHAPLVQVLLAYQHGEPRPGIDGLALEPLPVPLAGAKLDLLWSLTGSSRGIVGSLDFARDVFDDTTAERLCGHLLGWLEQALAGPGRRISEIDPLSPAERWQMLAEWSGSGEALESPRTLFGLFAERRAAAPEAPAVVYGAERLSYRELGERADRLLAGLREAGLAPGDRVAVCLRRGPDAVAAALAVLAGGAAYVPLDPNYPAQRLAFLLADSAPAVLLTERRLAERLPAPPGRLLLREEVWTRPVPAGPVRPAEVAASAPAYVIYTSGSTGRPKGVVVPHAAACNRLLWSQAEYPLAPGDRVLQGASLSFDFSIWEIFGTLIAGACLVLPEPGAERETPDLARLLAEQRVTVAHFVPSALRALLDGGELAECSSLRLLLSGGEALPADVQDRILAALPGVELYNQYGPTETTIDSTFWRCRRSEPGRPVPIGRPIAGTRAYVLDAGLLTVPIGAPGELYIGGAGLAQGYFERPATTAERFLPDPWSGEPGARLYRTGDLASFRADGALRYLGRSDHQVKLRGFRIELEEVDAALLRHPGVREAATVLREDVPGLPRLVSYLVAHPGAAPAADELRALLASRLPEHMLPAVLVELPALPRSPAGKLDRLALPAPGRQRPALSQGYVPARTPIEELLAGVWSELLGIEPIGVADDFFALGGHSLLAGRLAARIRETFGVDLPLALLFEQPTVAALAAAIAGAAGGAPEGPRPGSAREMEALPLSFPQQRLWFLQQAFPGSSAYHVPGAVRLRGTLRPEALAWSLGEIVRRHEVLRTVFPSVDGEPFQRIVPPAATGATAAVEPPRVCLAALSEEPRRAELERLAGEEARRPFSLAAGPLHRAVLVHLAPEEQVLLLTLHHIVFDGHSLGLLLAELAALYGAAVRGEASPLSAPPLQYADFAVWQRERIRGEVLAGHLRHFRDALAGAPSLVELPTDHPRPPVQSLRGASVRAVLDGDATAALRAFGRRHGATLFMVLLAGFAKLLERWTGQEDLVVGTVVASRDRPELAGLIGCCTNFLPLRLTADGAASGRELLARVRAAALAAYAHQECPFELVVEALNPGRRRDHNPVYNVGLLLQGFPHRSALEGGVGLEILNLATGTALLDLRLVAQEEGDRLWLDLEHATDLFTTETAAALLAACVQALADLRELPEAPLAAWRLPAALATQAAASAARRTVPKLALAATFTADPLAEPLRFWMEQLGFDLAIELAPYNQVFQQLLDPASRMARNASGVNILLVRLEDWLRGSAAGLAAVERTADDFLAALRAASDRTSVPWLVGFGPSSPAAPGEELRRIERRLCVEIAAMPGVHAASTAELSDLYPVADPFDEYSDRTGHIPYTPTMWSALASLLARKIYALESPPYKVIALDCDQTLWRGVCGEDGPSGVEIDAGRRALQEFMRAQLDAGMLLCLCSKNNEEDALAVFAHHPEMPLRLEHFVARRINWRPKSENLRSLAVQLGLGLDSFILVDDSPVECLEVETACPEVLALTLPANPGGILPWLKHVWAFDHLETTAEDRERTALYRAHLEREDLRAQAPTLEEFIAGLEVEVEVRPACAQELPRIAQLTQRTNQFNVSTRRRTEAEIAALCAGGAQRCLGVTVRDRFGHYGLVGAVIYEPAGDALVIDTFLLSCRVLGRGVEHQVLARLGRIALAAGAARLEIPFLPTAKNRPALDFLDGLEGVTEPRGEGGERLFILAAERASRLALLDAATAGAIGD